MCLSQGANYTATAVSFVHSIKRHLVKCHLSFNGTVRIVNKYTPTYDWQINVLLVLFLIW